jgi:hypothetical protein
MRDPHLLATNIHGDRFNRLQKSLDVHAQCEVDEIALWRLEGDLLDLGLGARYVDTQYLGYYIVSSLTIITLHASIKSKVIHGA